MKRVLLSPEAGVMPPAPTPLLYDLAAARVKAVLLALALGAAATAGAAPHEEKDTGAKHPQGNQPLKDRHGDALPPGAVARLGTVRLRTTADAFLVSSDGKTLLTVSGGRTVGRWDAATGLLLGETHVPGVPGYTA